MPAFFRPGSIVAHHSQPRRGKSCSGLRPSRAVAHRFDRGLSRRSLSPPACSRAARLRPRRRRPRRRHPASSTSRAGTKTAAASTRRSTPRSRRSTRRNVGRLTVAWTYPSDEAYLFNPLIVNGTMYVLAKKRSIVALDAATGKEKWVHQNEGAVGARGMSYWQSADGSEERLLYVNAGFLTAIDAKTGDTIESFGDKGRVDLRVGLDMDLDNVRLQPTSNPGRVFQDLIIMSLPAGGAGYASSPADIHAYNVRTGALTWVFHTVPHPGEPGAETWPAAGLGKYGGVHNWSESTIDVETGNDLHPDRHRALRLLRREPRGREPLWQQPARARRAQRQAALALPGDPSRSVGLRLSDRAEAAHGPARRRRRCRSSLSRASKASSTCSTGSRARRSGRSKSAPCRRATCRVRRAGRRSRSRPRRRRSRASRSPRKTSIRISRKKIRRRFASF